MVCFRHFVLFVIMFIFKHINNYSIQSQSSTKMECFYERAIICTKHCNYISYITQITNDLFFFCCKQITKRREISYLMHSRTHQSIETINITRYENGIAAKIVCPKIYFFSFLLLLLATVLRIQFLYGALIPYVNFLTLNF